MENQEIPTQVAEFLSFSEPKADSGRFVLGTFENRVTLYRQQVRAINLVYAIHNHRRNGSREFDVAVIGGGVAGLTAAAAAAALDMRVHLFEKKPTLLSLQQGCDIRWLHPHIYDWPIDGTELPYAGLPLLDWEESTAGDVARQLVDKFHARFSDRIEVWVNAKNLKISGRTIAWQNATRMNSSDKNDDKKFDAIVFAVGFGIENHVGDDTKNVTSYWRNDSLNQISPGFSGEKSTVFVSGIGDGGLIDLLRACLDGFHHGRLLREFLPPEDKRLYKAIRKLVSAWKANKETPRWLYDEYAKLHKKGLFGKLRDRIEKRLRQDNHVVLNGQADSFALSLSLEKASTLNTLLAFQLHKLNAFDYESGRCRVMKKSLKLNGKSREYDDRSIRHGTDRLRVLRESGFEEAAALYEQNKFDKTFDSSHILWPPGWWGKNSKMLGGEGTEFVPPATQLVATTFMATLSDVLRASFKKNDFRMTLHRLLEIREGNFYQQICRYSGTKLKGEVGRVYPVSKGLVGLACRLGKPVVIQGSNRTRSREAVSALGAEELDSTPLETMFAVPFLNSYSRATYVPLVLFIDTEKPKLLDSPKSEFAMTVYEACRGFVENIETMKKNNELFFSNTRFRGFCVTQRQRIRNCWTTT